MKTFATLIAVLSVSSLLCAQSAPVAKPTELGKTTPTTKAVQKKKEEPKIPGTSVMRADGTYVGLEVVNANFKLSFYDKDKKIMAPPVTRATARWPNSRAPGDDRTVLNPSGNALIGAKPVRPPFTFNVYLTLLEGEGDGVRVVESLIIPFRG